MRAPRLLAVLALTVVAILFTGAARRRAVRPPVATILDLRRSFAITDQSILAGFSFERVLRALTDRSGTRTTPSALIRQLFDTQNPKPGVAVANAPHCDDFLLDGQPSFNGFPRRCPTPEGAFAKDDPFAGDGYLPIGIFNRFDLTPPDGANCGQYRIIFARLFRPGVTDRVHLIFEGVLPNPAPQSGLSGCRAVAEFWASLSTIDSVSERRAQLEQFFFTGLPGFEPAFDPSHYTFASGGGIRTMQHTPSSRVRNRFYQFRLAARCDAGDCTLVAEPDVLENVPFGRFFDGRDTSPIAREFRDEFVRQVGSLAIADVNLYSMNLPRRFLIAESDPTDAEPVGIPVINFLNGSDSPDGAEFSGRITAELRRIGSPISPMDVITRAETQGCVICHAGAGPIGGGLQFPNALTFQQHVDEAFVEPGDGGSRFRISSAMTDVFIPHRMAILRAFLETGAAPVHSN